MSSYAEVLVRLGRLCCVISQPAKYSSPCALLLLNAGLIPRSGPFRLHVLLGRAVAREGLLAVRVDLPGVGESDQQLIEKNLQDSVIEDLLQVIDQLASQYGITKIIVFGICTGADFAHRLAVQDKRVVGVCGVDGYLYPTWKSFGYQLLPLLKNPVRLVAAVMRRLRSQHNEGFAGDSDFSWQLPGRAVARQQFMQLQQRSVSMLMIFTGSYIEYHYAGQLQDAIPEFVNNQGFLEIYFPESDHLFSIKSDQQKLIDAVLSWANKIIN